MEILDSPELPDTNRLVALLRAEPEFDDVHNARALISQDESGLFSNVFVFGYRSTTFFVKNTNQGVQIETGERDEVLGKLSLDSSFLGQLKRLLDANLTVKVVVNEYGESIMPYRDDRSLEVSVGHCVRHAVCRCWVDVTRVSENFRAMHCRKCGLRVVIPESVNTFRDLREHFKQWNP